MKCSVHWVEHRDWKVAVYFNYHFNSVRMGKYKLIADLAEIPSSEIDVTSDGGSVERTSFFTLSSDLCLLSPHILSERD